MSSPVLTSSDGLQPRAILPTKPHNPDGLVLSAWAQGFMVGAIIIMTCITVANMRRGILLHKLIFLELILGISHGTYIFPNPPAYAWYLSITALFLNVSWSLHNVIAWMKNKPFLGKKASMFYIGTVILAQPYWVLEIYADFAYFAGTNRIFVYTRPWEALFRDPWWIFTTWSLFYNIRTRYSFAFFELISISPRFGILLGAMLLSIAFIILDILAVTNALKKYLPAGIDPFWELAFVFKLLTDTMILDDFKSALDRLHNFKLAQLRGETRGSRVTTAYVDDEGVTPRRRHRHRQQQQQPQQQQQRPSVISALGDEIEMGRAPWSNDLSSYQTASWTSTTNETKPHSSHREHQDRDDDI